MQTKILKWIALIFVSIVFISFISLSAFKKSNNYVDLSKKDNGIVFFYKDDCSDCNKIFNKVVWDKATGKNITFVNLNNQKNSDYINTYFLSSVPTFTKLKHGEIIDVYEGTNMKQINKILKE